MTIVEAKNERPARGARIRFDVFTREGSPRDRGPRIRCPRCVWEPERDSLWMCTCLYVWNTFDTRGKCPGCGRQWMETCCLRCHEWSPHGDWYADEDERDA
ncbi:MAG TPA: hypothetical protein VEK15_02575 [Vicinamibacteria bacterium]|nr:hypothetical protein [Vicinamibacteria bacterium]